LIGRHELGASSRLRGLTPEEAWNRHGVLLLEAHEDTRLAAGEAVTLLTTRESYASLCDLPKRKPASLARLVRLGRALRGIWTNSARGLRAVFLMLLALIVVSIFLFQHALDLKFVDAYYYVLTTVTTVGYGDISPRDASSFAKVYATFVMVLGSMTLAVLYAMVTDFVIRERVRAALGGPGPALSKHVVVVGLGNVGYRTVDELARLGIETTAVDRDPERALLNASLEQASLVAGDGRLPATLSSARIEHATALVAATGDDAANLGAALTARRLAPTVRTVVRVFDGDFARKVEEGGLANAALSSSRAAAPAFVAAALFEGVLAAYTDERGLVALVEMRVSQDKMLASDIAHANDVRCVARLSAAGSMQPLAPDARLRKDERLLCLARRPFVARHQRRTV
jgi:Trk K+ transport system NAD-binding subunit